METLHLRRTHVLLLMLQLPYTTPYTAASAPPVLVLHLSFLELAWSGPLALACCWSVMRQTSSAYLCKGMPTSLGVVALLGQAASKMVVGIP